MERGGVLGVGPGASLYKQGHLPAPHTDFILAIIGEETGLVGMLFLLACYGAVIFFCFQIGHVAGKPFESLLCAGVGSLLAMQVLCNMSVVLNILPVTGMPLPLVSYGGSGLLCCLLALGLVLGISRQNGQDEKQDAE
jgi:cell division protein FtsW